MKNLSISRSQFNSILDGENISRAARLLIDSVANEFFNQPCGPSAIYSLIEKGVRETDAAGGKIAAIKWLRQFVFDNLEARTYFVHNGGVFNEQGSLSLLSGKQTVEKILGI